MELKKIEDRLSRLTSLVDGWKREGGVSRIERDIALEELRRIYDELAECEVATERRSTIVAPTATVEEVEESPAEDMAEEAESEVEQTVESISDMGDAFDDALDIDAILGIDAEPMAEPEPEHTPEPTSEPEPTPAPEPTPTPEPKVGGGLFDIDDIPVRTKAGRKMIALYNAPVTPKAEPKAEPVVTPEPEPMPEPTPEPVVAAAEPIEAPKRLADVLGSGVTVLGDKIAGEEAPTTPFNRIADLRKAIGLNDKFLMIRDLFAGDAALYEDTIDRLNEFDDLDECMIFIVENFRWNPDSEGAKLLVSLIERKLA